MSQSEAPYLKNAVYETGHLASREEFVDGAVSIDRVQRDLARDGNLDHPGPAILSEEFIAVYAEKSLRHSLVELGPKSQAVIETINQSVPGEREMNLALSVPGRTARPMFLQSRVEPVGHLVPSLMG